MPLMRAAVEKVATLEETESDRKSMAKGFLWLSVVWFLVTTAVAALAFWSAADGNIWGFVIFVLGGGWSFYETASSPVVLGKMYETQASWKDWLQSLSTSLVWLYLFRYWLCFGFKVQPDRSSEQAYLGKPGRVSQINH